MNQKGLVTSTAYLMKMHHTQNRILTVQYKVDVGKNEKLLQDALQMITLVINYYAEKYPHLINQPIS